MESIVTQVAHPPSQKRAGFSFESVASRSAKYRPDVDGLRAIAVLAVLFYHLDFKTTPFGYVGVDVFYVISGYLITSLIVKDLEAGKFSISSFYERRIRRIFPALFTVLAFCILAASALFAPPEFTRFGKSLLTTTLFASNFYFWHSALPTGYFDTQVFALPLLHTWSLAVEEQFYVCFPLTLYLLFRYAKRNVAVWLAVLSAASFGLNLWTTQHNPIVAFYWIAPRAWELLVGALLALKAIPLLRNRVLREIAGVLGLVMILVAITFQHKAIPFPGVFVLLPCLGAWLVIYAGEADPTLANRILSLRPIVFIGVLSYSLYLWHWPLIVFGQHLPFLLSGRALTIFVLFSSLALSLLSFEFIERPFRGGGSKFSRRQVFALGFAATIATSVFGLIAYRTNGLWQRYDPHTRQIIATNLARIDDFDSRCGNFRTEVHGMNDIKFCYHGPELPHKILFWGDSHVEQLHPVIEDLYNSGELQGRGAILAIEAGCLPDENINFIGDGFHCDSFARFAQMRALWPDVDVVFIGFSAWLAKWDDMTCFSVNDKCVRVLSRSEQRDRFAADLNDEIRTLKQHGKIVIVALPFPIYSQPIPAVESSNAVFGRFGLTFVPDEISSPTLREAVKESALRAGAEIFDPRETLCRQASCLIEQNGIAVYKDESHMAKSSIHLLEPNLHNVLDRSFADVARTRAVDRNTQAQ
jgi:peptidoglycan/LPS O-acetylase OafA/YrhL